MSDKNLRIAAIAIACVVLVLVFKRRADTHHDTTPKNQGVVVDDVVVLPNKSASPPPTLDAATQEKILNDYVNSMVPFTETHLLQEDQTHVLVKVRFVPLAVCQFGDFNAIEHDYRQKTPNKIILTMEPMNPKSKTPVSLSNLSLTDLKEGFQKTFEAPKELSSEVMGIMICSDSSELGRCLGKDVINFNFAQPPTTGRKPPYFDKSYFFSALVISGKKAQFVTRTPITAATLSQLLPVGTTAAGKINATAVANTVSLSDKLHSFPLDTKNGILTINIAYYDKSACIRKGK